MALNAKQSKFCNEYLKDLNATQAAIRAGYSPKTAQVQGSQLLSNLMVKEVLAQKMAKRAEKTEITAERVLLELSRLAFLDVRKAFNKNGSLKAIHELDDDTAAAVAGMDITEFGSGDEQSGVLKKIKLSDKKGALELVMRHLGMLTPAVQVDLDSELKKVDLERKRLELERLKSGGGTSMEAILRDLIARMPG